MNKVVEKLCEFLITHFNYEIELSSVPIMIQRGLKFVENYNRLNGVMKKQVISSSIRYVVDKSNITGYIEPVVLAAIPILVNKMLIVNQDNGSLSLNFNWVKSSKRVIKRMER